jgi:hypothetical protein
MTGRWGPRRFCCLHTLPCAPARSSRRHHPDGRSCQPAPWTQKWRVVGLTARTFQNERGRQLRRLSPLLLGPGLLPTLALEHADRAAIVGIEHGPNQRGLLVAIVAGPDWIGVVAGKDFVFELVTHGWPARRWTSLSSKVNSCSLLHRQNCKMAWNRKTKLGHCLP